MPRRVGLFVLVILLVGLGLLTCLLEPWVPWTLKRDVTRQKAEFLRAAQDTQAGATIDLDQSNFSALNDLGYYRLHKCGETALFFKYRHFRSIGTIGVAVSPPGQSPVCMSYDKFHPLVDKFYIWNEE